MPSRDAEKLKLVRYEFLDDQKMLDVYDYTLGTYNKPQLKPSEIAKKLGVSPSTVTRMRQTIAKKIEEFE
jgi:DNA-binding MarR family transcriptional regulator